jgi:hypothetical protein
MIKSQVFCVTEQKMKMRRRYGKLPSKILGIKNQEN